MASARRSPGSGTSLANAIEMQLNQGKVREAAATLTLLRERAPGYAGFRLPFVLYAQGEDQPLRHAVDSLRRTGTASSRAYATAAAGALALMDGRLREWDALQRGIPSTAPSDAQTDPIDQIIIRAAVLGPSAGLATQLDAALAKIPFGTMPMVDRPYLSAATALARTGSPVKARAMLARYRAEVTDTAMRREQQADLHTAQGEIALAERRTAEALTEFLRGDVGYDGQPANECAPCLPFNLARSHDAAGQSDSAIVMFERYLATPYWFKIVPGLDPVRKPAIHERLGQLYEAKGSTEKAAEHYRAFIELWKNADPELQPRVAAAKERLKKLTSVERPKP